MKGILPSMDYAQEGSVLVLSGDVPSSGRIINHLLSSSISDQIFCNKWIKSMIFMQVWVLIPLIIAGKLG